MLGNKTNFMKSQMNHRILAAATAILLGIAAPTRADQTAATFNDSSITVATGGPNVYGWQFYTYSDIQVSALGLYDYYKGDGFVAAHPIGIWDISNPSQPVVSAIIPAGTVAPIVQDFFTYSIVPEPTMCSLYPLGTTVLALSRKIKRAPSKLLPPPGL
jgi:hypothetical protein